MTMAGSVGRAGRTATEQAVQLPFSKARQRGSSRFSSPSDRIMACGEGGELSKHPGSAVGGALLEARRRPMQREELKAVFDQQAPGYDKQWARMAPIRDGLHFLLESVFAGLPADARILCVGVGSERVRLMPKTWRYCRPSSSHPSLNQPALSHPFNSSRPV
jgi:hypothetical protein